MKYRWLLFDADGTLFDYDRAEAMALAATFEQFGYQFNE
jgi:phosphoglycolate phosphatase-like HAD superfamily hydrolase